MMWMVWLILALAAVVVGFGLARLQRQHSRQRLYSRLQRTRGFRETAPVSSQEDAAMVPEMAASSCRVTLEKDGLRLDVFENLEPDIEPGAPTETQTMIAVRLPDIDIPSFVIDPRSMPVEVKMKIEMEEGITISGEEAFSAYNVVTAPDPETIRRLLRDAGITPLLYGNRSLTVESRGNFLVFYDAEHLMSIRRILQVCDAALTFASRIREVMTTGEPLDRPSPPPLPTEVYG